MNGKSFAITGSFEKPLNAKDETAYLIRKEKGDIQAQDVLVRSNLRLVVHIVKKYHHSILEAQDLISIGTIGLIKGIKTFNRKKGTRLATYVAKCIENEILMHLRQTKKEQSVVSINDSIGFDDEGNDITLMDVISMEQALVEDQLYKKSQIQILYEKMQGSLKKRERTILALRYGLYNGEGKTQKEIGEALSISRSYVSRIEKRAIQKLKEDFKKDLRIEP